MICMDCGVASLDSHTCEPLRRALRSVVFLLEYNNKRNAYCCFDDPDWTGVAEALEIAYCALENEKPSKETNKVLLEAMLHA